MSDAPSAASSSDAMDRIPVRRTAKLYLGGAFPRSESGRSYPVHGADGRLLANAAQGSRKDVRDAVVAARKAQRGWAGKTAYNRGQVLYRAAELLEGRREQLTAEVAAAEGLDGPSAAHEVEAAVDRLVWYAGWADKVMQVAGSANPVAGPYFGFSVPEPMGVVGIVAPPASSLLGLVSVLAPVVVTGNTAVALVSEQRPLPAVSVGEILATSDVPGGVINLITGHTEELLPPLAAHRDVDALDLTGADSAAAVDAARAAADSLIRTFRPRDSLDDWHAEPGTRRLLGFLETKSVWHPAGG